MKIRELEVVSSSFNEMMDRTCQGMASVESMCPQNFALFLSWLVSLRCIVS